MTYYDQNALKLCHAFWRERLRPGMTCVDATAGRGRDAEVLCRLIGETGHLYAFDIQADAIESTRQRLTEAGLMGRATLIHASHRRMAEYVRQRMRWFLTSGICPMATTPSAPRRRRASLRWRRHFPSSPKTGS
ncbi:MAG: class I SAM-dependent methyltransferase [Angelakisella sp.]